MLPSIRSKDDTLGPRGMTARRGAIISIRRAARFRRDEEGATAVELGFVLGPFLFALLALFEVALTFLSNQSMHLAVDNVARQIRTGEVKAPTSSIGSQSGFIDAICAEAYLLYDCKAKLKVDVRMYPTFEAMDPPTPLDEDEDFNAMAFEVGEASSIIVARAFYKRDPIAPMFTKSPARLSDGSLLLSTTFVFQNEPYE